MIESLIAPMKMKTVKVCFAPQLGPTAHQANALQYSHQRLACATLPLKKRFSSGLPPHDLLPQIFKSSPWETLSKDLAQLLHGLHLHNLDQFVLRIFDTLLGRMGNTNIAI